MRWNGRDGYSVSWRDNCCFDPVSLTAASMAATAAGGAASAASTLAGGSAAKSAGDFTAAQLRSNAAQARAAGQRKMFDTQLKTKLAIGTSVANAAGSGVSADVGSPLENRVQLAGRGEYQALMDMFNGESEATGLESKAKAAEYEGETKQRLALLSALGTLAGSAGTMATRYGMFKYPTQYGRAGLDL